MLVLATKPLEKLTGTGRQTGRQADGRTDKPVYWEAAPPKSRFEINILSYTTILDFLDNLLEQGPRRRWPGISFYSHHIGVLNKYSKVIYGKF